MPQLVAPSVALNQAFVLPQMESPAAPPPQAETARVFTAYAVVVGNLGLLLPTETASTMVDDGVPFCPLPHTPPWLRGMANYYGNVIPIFDLEALLAFPPSVRGEPKVLFIGEGESTIGITVAAPPVRVRLSTAAAMTGSLPLPPIIRPYVRASYKQERVWMEWDVQGFFTAAGARI
jgi:hypothetical protein